MALLYVMISCVFVTFPCGVLGQMWYLIVLIPDLCPLPYFDNISIYLPNIIKISQNGWNLWSVQGFPIKFHSGKITQTGSMGELLLSNSYTTLARYICLPIIKRSQRVLKLFPFKNSFKRDNYKMKPVSTKVAILAHDTIS